MRDTIDMAHEAQFEGFGNGDWVCTTEEIKAFEALVRADEREAMAKLAETLEWADHKGIASAIRARGNT
jgi:hypothetical protein